MIFHQVESAFANIALSAALATNINVTAFAARRKYMNMLHLDAALDNILLAKPDLRKIVDTTNPLRAYQSDGKRRQTHKNENGADSITPSAPVPARIISYIVKPFQNFIDSPP